MTENENTSPPSWETLGLSPEILELIQKAGYKTPTPVQVKSIPEALDGMDLMVSSQTGSGKTASFVLPAIQKCAGREGVVILALAPTREIAQQTHAVFEQFGAPFGLRSAVLIGGVDMRLDEAALKTYPQIIVATPGRLVDHIERGQLWLDYIQFLILDEADRMLDMGFSAQLNRIVEETPQSRQTLLFSATFAPSVNQFARKILKDPVKITIGSTSSAAPAIQQRAILVHEDDKIRTLVKILDGAAGPIMIFTGSKDGAGRLWQMLHQRGVYDSTYIHSDRTQGQREQVLADFKENKYRILIATDIAGRGIDVEDVQLVVNFDLPRDPEDYVHRIGRTGRKGKTGNALSLVNPKDQRSLEEIEKLLRIKIPTERAAAPAGNRGGRPQPTGNRSAGPKNDSAAPRASAPFPKRRT